MTTLLEKSFENVRNLIITQVMWFNVENLGFALSDGQSCIAGTKWHSTESFDFSQTKKVSKIECIIRKNESLILQINFFHREERLV